MGVEQQSSCRLPVRSRLAPLVSTVFSAHVCRRKLCVSYRSRSSFIRCEISVTVPCVSVACSFWARREPNNYRGNQDCGAVNFNSRRQWDDRNCRERVFGAVCEKRKRRRRIHRRRIRKCEGHRFTTWNNSSELLHRDYIAFDGVFYETYRFPPFETPRIDPHS